MNYSACNNEFFRASASMYPFVGLEVS